MEKKTDKRRLFEMMSRLDENFNPSTTDANRDDVLSFQELSELQKLTQKIKSRFDGLSDENIENLKRVLGDSFEEMIRKTNAEPKADGEDFFNYKGDSTTYKI